MICYQAQNVALKNLVSLTWADILHMFTVASSFVTGKCCYILLQGMHSLVALTHELMLDDARGSAINAFCNILITPETLEVKNIAYETVTSAIETSPAAFDDHWTKIMSALSEFRWAPSSPEFCSSLTVRQLIEICQGLLTIANGGNWALGIVNEFLLANLQRFPEIWPSIEKNFLADNKLIATSFWELFRDGFCESSEKLLCSTLEKRFKIGLGSAQLLEAMRQLLSQNSTVLVDGWEFIIQALKPEYVSDNINDAFRCVEIIANDLMFHLPNQTQSEIIQLIFEFAGQLIDINISLSSFGLLWNVVSICSTLEMWKTVLGGAAHLISSPQNDVALCAAKTFFSLLVSNVTALPTEIFQYVAIDLFLPLIEFLVKAPEEAVATQQLAFQELAHCGRNLWDQFKSVELFGTEMWLKLIIGHEHFMKTCSKRDILIQTFQFYEEAFQCTELPENVMLELYDSFYRLTVFFVKRENAKSPIYGSMGRVIQTVLPLQKSYLTKQLLKKWIEIIEYPIFDLESGGLLPPTSHKAMDALVLLFPLPIELAVLVYESLVKMACNDLNNSRLTGIALEHITDVCHKVGDDLLPTFFVLSKNLFRLKGARKLLLEFVQKDIPIQDEIVEDVATSLMSLGKSDLELKEKTATSVLKLYPRLSNNTKLEFIEIYKDSLNALSALLQMFCDPKSTLFVSNIAELCTKKTIQLLGKLMLESDSEELLVTILKFLLKLTTPGIVFEDCFEENQHYHLFFLLPVFAELVLKENPVIKKQLRKIFLMISTRK